jgi:alcohol dehydrogenase, propanol-preferring
MMNLTPSTYRAVQVSSPGKFELVERPLVDPPAGKVRLRIEACGICHSDAATVEGLIPGITFPRAPGHEVVGRIDAVGDGVTGWGVDQRVGVGFLRGHCGVCRFCRRGDFVNCTNQPFSGIHFDGGYAESMIASPSGLVAIPDELSSTDAAPLLCGGLTSYNALRHSSAEPGDLVAVQGIGGLAPRGRMIVAGVGSSPIEVSPSHDRNGVAGEGGRRLCAHGP